MLRAILWPVMIPVELLQRAIDKTDPGLQDRIIADQRERIQELEKDLGL